MTRLLLCIAASLFSYTGMLHAHHGPPHTDVDEFLEPLKKEAPLSDTGIILAASLAFPAAVIILLTALSRRVHEETPPA